MSNKKKRTKKEKKAPEYRSKEERQSEVKHVLAINKREDVTIALLNEKF